MAKHKTRKTIRKEPDSVPPDNVSDPKELKRLATESVKNLLISGDFEGSVRQLCADYGVNYSTITAKMVIQDWPTPKRVAIRRQEILEELNQYGRIYRPKGTTECDDRALGILRSTGIPVTVEEFERPGEPEEPDGQISIERTGSKPLKLKSFGKKALGTSARLQQNGCESVSQKAARGPIFETKVVESDHSPPVKQSRVPAILDATTQNQVNVEIATLARKAIAKAAKLGVTISKPSDLRLIYDMYRTATGQKDGASSGRGGLVNINLLGDLTSARQKTVRGKETAFSQVIEVKADTDET